MTVHGGSSIDATLAGYFAHSHRRIFHYASVWFHGQQVVAVYNEVGIGRESRQGLGADAEGT